MPKLGQVYSYLTYKTKVFDQLPQETQMATKQLVEELIKGSVLVCFSKSYCPCESMLPGAWRSGVPNLRFLARSE